MEGIELARIIAGEDHAPVVYFIRIEGRVKIGWTTNLGHRVIALSLSLDDVVKVVPGGRDVEQALHERWADHRIQGEWFQVRGSLGEFLTTAHTRRTRINRARRQLSLMQTRRQSSNQAGPVTLWEASTDRGTGVVHLRFAALSKAAQRDRKKATFPEPVGQRGRTPVYDPVDLQRWAKRRPRPELAIGQGAPA